MRFSVDSLCTCLIRKTPFAIALSDSFVLARENADGQKISCDLVHSDRDQGKLPVALEIGELFNLIKVTLPLDPIRKCRDSELLPLIHALVPAQQPPAPITLKRAVAREDNQLLGHGVNETFQKVKLPGNGGLRYPDLLSNKINQHPWFART